MSDAAMPDVDRDEIVQATLPHVAFEGWSRMAVAAGLTDLGLPTDQPGFTKDDLEARANELEQSDDEKAALLDRIEHIEPSDLQSTGSNTAAVSDTIFTQYLVPFEVVSVLLLAALVGAIVLARKE